MEHLIVHVDGAVGAEGGKRGAGVAAVVRDSEGRVCHLLKEWIPGPVTNNEAEYGALLLALKALAPLSPGAVTILSDSEVMVKQVNGLCRVGSAALQPLHQEACARLAAFPQIALHYVPREENRLADALAWEAANGWAKG
ncbi:MAG: ribonuclease HI family protein [Ardenticatenaceae bacterium]